MKYILSLLIFISIGASAQVFLPSTDTIKITYKDSMAVKDASYTVKVPYIAYRDSTIVNMYSVLYRVPVVTVSPTLVSQPPPVVIEPTGYSLVFSSGYDKFEDISTNSGQYGYGKISTTFYKTGPGSFYSIPKVESAGTRSEVQYTYDYQNPKEGAIEYDVYYEKLVNDAGHSLQNHPVTSGASACPGLLHEGGYFTVVRWKMTRLGAANDYGRTSYKIPVGKWIHIRMEFKFALSYAYCRVYVDGVKIYDLPATAEAYLGDSSGGYWKVGWNGWLSSAFDSRIYYDNFKIWKKQ